MATPLFGKKWPVPVARPMMPFYAAGLIVLYGINSFAGVLANTDEYKNDPRNPNARAGSH
ncbi:uncharacterized protein PV09_07541 [Verruconis gallopava]|uniref:ATP synthase subunit J, mitochondrial n=1 Tax=Verruconis gallopava TaxID=253628 RepID=A0A0D2A3P3_9PEZI|nr:uncharacterized protein PV09_07541 [Verruconis gallopava]KIW01025.1 hypothetical protein PV09_07541 [Verruconis gallopava]